MEPLVSVVMPYYECRATLRRALASLLAQSHENWELVFVDDGSSDRPREILEEVADPRWRYFRFERNRGRGAARHLALARARGDFVCMLDADDWIYPRRLEYQLEVMAEEPRVHLVSGGIAVIDRAGRLTGVRRLARRWSYPRVHGPLKNLLSLPVAHAPSMIRMAAAREADYNPNFRSFEDKEFLLRIVLARAFCILPRLVYAYAESEQLDLKTQLAAYRSARGVYHKHTARFPFSYRAVCAALAGKSLAYRVAARLGIGHRLIAWRSHRPSEAEIEEFEEAKTAVDAIRIESSRVIWLEEPGEATSAADRFQRTVGAPRPMG